MILARHEHSYIEMETNRIKFYERFNMKLPEQDKHNQQRCNKCGRIVGCDYHGRKHKCGCNQGGK